MTPSPARQAVGLEVNPVRATDDPSTMGVVDLVLFAVKLWDTEAVLEQIRPVIGPDTAIISFQNGVLKDSYLRAHYDPSQIMGGVGYVATTIDRPGVIRQTGPMQRLIFGEFDGGRSARGEAFLKACLNGGIKADPEVETSYPHFAGKMREAGLVYVHVVDHSARGALGVRGDNLAARCKGANLTPALERVLAGAEPQLVEFMHKELNFV